LDGGEVARTDCACERPQFTSTLPEGDFLLRTKN